MGGTANVFALDIEEQNKTNTDFGEEILFS